MNEPHTAEAISGRATGALFFSGFGSLWLCTGLAAMHRLNIVSGAAAAIVLILLVLWAVRLLQLVSKAPKTGMDAEREKEIKRTFGRVNTIQWIAIPVAVVAMNIVHRPEWIVPAIATIVGLHLFPLARLFRYPAHYVTGTLLVLWSVGAVVVLHREDIPSTGALGTAAILLLSSLYTLTLAERAAKNVLALPAKLASS
jgi:hypothetical protein